MYVCISTKDDPIIVSSELDSSCTETFDMRNPDFN